MIYLFECKKCQFKFHYVGITVTKFRYRFKLVRHLERPVDDKKELRRKELCWISKLNTLAPVGLNVREVCEAH